MVSHEHATSETEAKCCSTDGKCCKKGADAECDKESGTSCDKSTEDIKAEKPAKTDEKQAETEVEDADLALN